MPLKVCRDTEVHGRASKVGVKKISIQEIGLGPGRDGRVWVGSCCLNVS